MVRAARRKRASEDDLYRGCRMGQDCPIDIKNKYEHNTVADRILKWVSSFLYFGTLGISSGKGTGGPTGYTPLGSGSGGAVKPGRGANVVRPTVIVDALNPAGVPIDPAVPDAATVPLLEGGGGSTTLDTTPGGEIEVIAEVHPPPNVGHPEITVGDIDEPPILEVTPETHPTSRVRSTTSKHDNPAFTAAYVASSQLPGETSATDHVYILHGFNGEFVGPAQPEGDVLFEEIPLEEFGVPESPPSSSTPDSTFRRVLNRFQRRLYNRRLVQQVKITDRNTFLRQPSQFVQWEFENPTFSDDSLSLIFQQDVNEVTAAPDADFQDIVRLSRPIFSDNEGLVRISRLGQRATITTRSGLQIGGHVHYYTDISPIRPLEDIEMTTFGEVSGESIIMQPLGESTFVDAGASAYADDFNAGRIEYTDSLLEDDLNEDFRNARLEFSTTGSRTSIMTIQEGIPPGSVKLFINDAAATVTPHYPPTVTPAEADLPFSPINPAYTPDIIINFGEDTATFILHPSLLRRRKHKHWFF
ncbi:L2 minor capsid protein [Bos taurus papillomavirus 37]|nr:L2 minor capsid protein [Bos taurus papillomavirus 37]